MLLANVAPTSIVVDSQNVYWSNSVNWSMLNSSVNKIPIGGGTPVTLAANQMYTNSLVLHDTNLFFETEDGVSQVSTNGGAVTDYSAYGYATPIVTDATNIYWAFSPVGVQKVAINGGAVTTLAADSIVQGGQAFAGPYAIAVDANYVYWADWMGYINKVPIAGGAVTQLLYLGTQESVSAIVVDATNLYWVGAAGINKMSINGGIVTNLASNIMPVAIVLNDGNIYWADDVSIGKVSVSGGAVKVLASGPKISYAINGDAVSNCIAVDSSSVYWGTANGLYKIAK